MKDRCCCGFPRPLFALGLLVVASLLALPLARAQSVVEGAVVGNLTVGTPVDGTLEAGDPTLDDGSYFETWAYTLNIPGFLTIDLHSSGFDTYLFMALSDDTILSENDDCVPGDFSHSCIVSVPAVPDTYYIGVNTFGVGETGDYTLGVQFVPLVQAPEPSVALLLMLGLAAALRRRREFFEH